MTREQALEKAREFIKGDPVDWSEELATLLLATRREAFEEAASLLAMSHPNDPDRMGAIMTGKQAADFVRLLAKETQ